MSSLIGAISHASVISLVRGQPTSQFE